MSNRARTSNGRNFAMARVMSTPEPPGPPGFSSSDPIRSAGVLAGNRITDSEIVAPLGWS
jgi:hypothetical protein